MKILLLGNGAWGSALASVLKTNNHTVSIWKRGARIPSGSTVIGATPTQAIREVLTPSLNAKKITYINSSKGIERDTHLLPYQIVTQMLGPDVLYFTLLGPSFSEEVKQKMPTIVNLGYRNTEKLDKIKKMFQTDYFRVRTTKSIRSLELSAAFKNIYAIACGVADGMGYGMNTRVKLMILAMEEFGRLREKLDYKIDDKAVPATLGDLILTCGSMESRNFSFGKLLLKFPPDTALKEVGHTVEGYYTVESVPHLISKADVKLPLASFVYEITHPTNTCNIKGMFSDFIKTTA